MQLLHPKKKRPQVLGTRMSINVFISYSHKDEAHKDSLNEHLSMLKRTKIIDEWNDRKIAPGQNWADEISGNLERSQLILFLVSPSFLASDYCFNIEAQRAIQMHKEGKAKLIPILIRACDWESCEFSKFQAVPKDALPITSWTNQDEAWLDAINGIKRHIDTFNPTPVTSPAKTIDDLVVISDGMLDWIDDTEVVLTHRKVHKVKLSHVYVSLDLEAEQKTGSKGIQISTSDIIFSKQRRYLISGEEQQGKTTLLKNAYKEFLKLKVAPIYINGN
jgi:hypothetical protein